MSSNRLETSEISDKFPTLTLSEFARLLLQRWKFIAVFSFTCAFSTAVITLMIPNKYTAKATILPASTNSNAGGLLSLTGDIPGLDMLGVNLGDNSPSILYPEILKSKTLADEVLMKKYSFNKSNKTVEHDLYQYFGTDNKDQAYASLMKATGISYNKKTGIVSISNTTEIPRLSAQIVNQFIECLNNYNTNQRKTGASQNREFIEQRISEIYKELQRAENSLKEFRNSNLNYYQATDPDFITEHNRLVREVEVKNQVYLTLAQQYEIATIQEKKENPVIQVLDYARTPSLKSSPVRKRIAFTGLLAGLFVSSLLVFLNYRFNSEYRLKDLRKYTRKLNFIRRQSKEKEKV